MSFFARPHYTSETTDFIATLKTQRPELEAAQRAGRELLWDKRIDTESKRKARQHGLPNNPMSTKQNLTCAKDHERGI